ncbi:MAG: carboxypeptidase-like regulatory domain-containing protein [Candidatus Anammoxibacter sp.]
MASKLKICLFTVSLFIYLTSIAGGIGFISGKVIDGFGVPLEGVNVEIRGTKYKVTTDSEGHYKINYRPGLTKITFTKTGHIHNVIVVNVSEVSDITSRQVTLWKYPREGGMYFIKGKDYILINRNTFGSERDSDGLRFIINGAPTVINVKEVTVLDYEKRNPRLSGKNLYRVYDNNLIGYLGASEFPLQLADDKYIKIAGNIGLRISTLEPGKYFYYTGFMNNRTRKGEGAFFEVKP